MYVATTDTNKYTTNLYRYESIVRMVEVCTVRLKKTLWFYKEENGKTVYRRANWLTNKQTTDDRWTEKLTGQVNYIELNEYEIIISVDHNRCSDLTKKKDNYVERLHKKLP